MMLAPIYLARIDKVDHDFMLEEDEVCSFITHFGKFGNIEIYNMKNERVVITTGIYLNQFYPDEKNRDFAKCRTKQIQFMFNDYKHQRKLKFPTGRLKQVYKEMMKGKGDYDVHVPR